MSDTPRHIETEIELDAPLEAVWKALTDADELTNWFPLEAEVNPGAGGSIKVAWGEPEYAWETPIDVWEENKHLRLVYAEPTPDEPTGSDEPSVRVPFRVAVDYHLESKGGVTVLRLVHSGFSSDASWDNQYDGTVRGWAFELRGLKHYLERHPGTKRHVVHAKRELGELPLDDAWTRLAGPEGLVADGAMPTAADQPYAFTTAAGDRMTGTTHIVNPPKDLCGTVDTMGDALLRLRLDESCFTAPKREVQLWLSTYGVPAGETDALRGRFQALLDTLYPTAAMADR